MERQSKKNSVATCKYLGLKTDPCSLASYPSGANCCHGCIPESVPNLAHQREFCLSDNHKNCPVFSADSLIHMPEEYGHRSDGKTKDRPGFWPAIIVIGILLGLIASVVLVFPNLLPQQADSAWSTPTQPLPSPIVSTNSARATNAAIEPIPTSTVEPSPIPEIILLPLLTELGTEYKVVIHRTARGDNLSSLAQMHRSWDQAILDATYNLVPPLTIGKLIVIPINNRNWQDQPPLEPYQITQPAISIDDLAQILGIDAALLNYYNGYEGYLIQQGSWVVIPRAP